MQNPIKRLKRLAGNILHHVDFAVFTDDPAVTEGLDNQKVKTRRPIVAIGDPRTHPDVADVLSRGDGYSGLGVVTELHDTMKQMLRELRLQNHHLAILSNSEARADDMEE